MTADRTPAGREPAASLVVPSHAGAQRLPILLRALLTQDTDDFEVVVVLDGDVDDSAGTLRPWADRLTLRVVPFAVNRGRSTALNAGHEAAKGRILVRCDDDLEPAPDFVRCHLAHHAGPAVGVVGMCRNVFPPTHYARVYGIPADRRLRAGAYAAPPTARWRYWGANVSVTRETWERIGPYDTGFRGYGLEDVDWGRRLAEAGVPLVIDPALETPHHVASTTTRIRTDRAFRSGAARPTFVARHGAALDTAAPTGVWGGAVRATAAGLGRTGLDRLATAVDALLPLLPRTAAEKAVALSVEAAARSGQIRAERTRAADAGASQV